ncbi:ubiquinol-cytochrome c reductase cytochrome c1 subunit (plasmid) [Legionella adelaidensis]|uniref:Ubiquinol-cytochrome c reductase cytochrome c1 subunit n=1 Tax=Legionella adelaidensis TaxID=45056 RepID=A0A0W0R0A6_9GAMM|nr:ubiquinol-cytochrome c reductase cytochrome c1 subunit [Legionella adelaidensis]VEH85892.1 ubiquinol-cytochrome c reductase cytochrome c1 subunit [Legionella adelaidensis]
MKKKILNIFFIFAFLCSLPLFADENNPPLAHVDIDVNNQARLQRGAKIYMNYCSGCHSLKYMRYNAMARDLGLTTFDGSVDNDLLINNLIFTRAKVHDPIRISMPEVDAREWFGKLPPDLSLEARARGASWLYTYLKSFYLDPKRPFGTNNLLIPDVAMPNVLSPLQGEVIAVHPENQLALLENTRLLLIQKGSMTQQQFDSTIQDLVTFLVYVSEPAQMVRYRIGVGVIVFLLILSFLAYRLKKIYWRKIH